MILPLRRERADIRFLTSSTNKLIITITLYPMELSQPGNPET